MRRNYSVHVMKDEDKSQYSCSDLRHIKNGIKKEMERSDRRSQSLIDMNEGLRSKVDQLKGKRRSLRIQTGVATGASLIPGVVGSIVGIGASQIQTELALVDDSIKHMVDRIQQNEVHIANGGPHRKLLNDSLGENAARMRALGCII